MTVQLAKRTLLWCIGINFAFLLLWSAAILVAHDVVYDLSARFFRVSGETFDTVNFAAIAAYKIGVLFFNVVPFFALALATKSRSSGA